MTLLLRNVAKIDPLFLACLQKSSALAMLFTEAVMRPLYGKVTKDKLASIHIFYNKDFVKAQSEKVKDVILKLEPNSKGEYMAELKTKANQASVEDFLSSIPDEKKRKDAFAVLELMQEVTKEKPTLWGSSIVGFGSYHYTYASGHEGDACMIGFSPRKQDLTIYINTGFEAHKELMQELGKYKTSKVCLYIKKLEDINLPILKKLIKASFVEMKKRKG